MKNLPTNILHLRFILFYQNFLWNSHFPFLAAIAKNIFNFSKKFLLILLFFQREHFLSHEIEIILSSYIQSITSSSRMNLTN